MSAIQSTNLVFRVHAYCNRVDTEASRKTTLQMNAVILPNRAHTNPEQGLRRKLIKRVYESIQNKLPSKDSSERKKLFVSLISIIRGDLEKDALLVKLDATNGFLRVDIESPHSASHTFGKRDGATNTNECAVGAAFAHHGRDKFV